MPPSGPLAVDALESATMGVSIAMPPFAVLLAWGLAAHRIRSGCEPKRAWRDTVAEVGAVVGTLPWPLLVLTPREGEGALRLVPLVDLAELAAAELRTIVEQLGGNLVLFAAAGCVAIEAAQYLFGTGRVASVDDVLLNTLGAVLAALASRRWRRLRSQRDEVAASAAAVQR
jgi:hypothetical protein